MVYIVTGENADGDKLHAETLRLGDALFWVARYSKRGYRITLKRVRA